MHTSIHTYIHTGAYADAGSEEEKNKELQRIMAGSSFAHSIGLVVNAGHGLTLDNVEPIAAIPEMNELNIGHSLIADALFVGIEQAVKQMKAKMIEVATD